MDITVFVEDVLSSVAVMHVPINDENSPQAICLLGMSSGNSDIIEQAKAHWIIGECVMARWSNQTERATVLRMSSRDLVNGGTCCSGSSNRCFIRPPTTNRIRFNSPAAVTAKSFDARDMSGCVNSQQLFLSRGDHFAKLTILKPLLVDQFRGNAAEAFRRFWVTPGVMFQKDRVGEENGHVVVRKCSVVCEAVRFVECLVCEATKAGLARCPESTGLVIRPTAAGRSDCGKPIDARKPRF